MVSKVNSSGVFDAYQNSTKDTSKTARKTADTTKAPDSNKLDALKQSVSSGNYKIDIKALAAKVADSLM